MKLERVACLESVSIHLKTDILEPLGVASLESISSHLKTDILQLGALVCINQEQESYEALNCSPEYELVHLKLTSSKKVLLL